MWVCTCAARRQGWSPVFTGGVSMTTCTYSALPYSRAPYVSYCGCRVCCIRNIELAMLITFDLPIIHNNGLYSTMLYSISLCKSLLELLHSIQCACIYTCSMLYIIVWCIIQYICLCIVCLWFIESRSFLFLWPQLPVVIALLQESCHDRVQYIISSV